MGRGGTFGPLRLAILAIAGAAALARPAAAANDPAGAAPRAMRPLADDELSAVRGADGIAFNLNHFSLTSSLTDPLKLSYLAPDGSSLVLSGLDLSRTDDADPFADPYRLSVISHAGLPDEIAIDFPLNAAGTQSWSLTTDFSNHDATTGTTFIGGTMQVMDLSMKGGGLHVAPSGLADTQGIAFGLGTRLDIGSLSVYPLGRSSAGAIDTSDAMTISGIHLADAASGGAWMLADLSRQPGLINAQTDTAGSYIHLQIGWPTTADPVPAGTLAIDNISFTTPGVNGAASTVTRLGSASIAAMQINYLDIKLRTSP